MKKLILIILTLAMLLLGGSALAAESRHPVGGLKQIDPKLMLTPRGTATFSMSPADQSELETGVSYTISVTAENGDVVENVWLAL